MKIAVKLPLAFAATVVSLLSVALFGMAQLNGSLDIYQTSVRQSNAAEQSAAEMLIDFKTQVQEWKNTLLRGKDPKQRERYWASFLKHEAAVAKKGKALHDGLGAGEQRDLLDKFLKEHLKMGEGYRKGFEAFQAADFEASVGDKAVSGMDRAPAALLDDLYHQLGKQALAASEEADRAGARATWISAVLMLLFSALGLVTGWLISRSVTQPLGDAVMMAQAVAQGDLRTVNRQHAANEFGQLTQAMDAMQHSLQQVVTRVLQGSQGIAGASAQLDSSDHELSSRTDAQASALEETAASMEELGSTVKQNADNARQANQLAQNASSVAIKGGEVVSQVVDTMKEINDSSKKIADIISVIDGIAFQTNILALNAAVEAARAGEQGRGFAVVASEVRSLAGRSAEAAREIKLLISDSVQRVEQGSALVDQAGHTMDEVVSSIRRVTDIMGEISAASSEQAQGVAQVGAAIASMDQATQQNATLVEEMAAAASNLKNQAQDLAQTVAVFKT